MLRLHVHLYLRGTWNEYSMVPHILPHQRHEVACHAQTIAEQVADPGELPVVEGCPHELFEVDHVLRYFALEREEHLGVVDPLARLDLIPEADLGLEFMPRVDDVGKHLEEFPLIYWLERCYLAAKVILKQASDVLIFCPGRAPAGILRRMKEEA